jgi:hypothetical protein
MNSYFFINKKIRTVRLYLILIASMLIISACKQDGDIGEKEPEPKTKSLGIGIIIIDDTVLRLDPTIYSAVVSKIKKGSEVTILDKSSKKIWLGGSNSYWYKVRFSRGYTGWVYGNNIKIFDDDDKDQAEKFLSKFWKEEHKKFVTRIIGRWRTIRTNTQNPVQFVEILDDEKYKSYVMDGETAINVHEGDYKVNYADDEIIFPNGAFFGSKLIFMVRENILFLVKDKEDDSIKFQRIARFK